MIDNEDWVMELWNEEEQTRALHNLQIVQEEFDYLKDEDDIANADLKNFFKGLYQKYPEYHRKRQCARIKHWTAKFFQSLRSNKSSNKSQ